MAFGPGRKAPIAAANQHCRQKSATPSCLGAAAARRVQSRCSSLPSSSATHASGRSQVQGRSVELRKCGSPVCREGAEMQEGPEKCRRAWRWCSCMCAVAQLHVCGGGHLLSKRRTLLGRTAEMGRTGEQAGLLGTGKRATHAAVTAADCRHWELQVVHARQ